MRLDSNHVLITGGTSGIGRALAEQLHRRGNRVAITGRRAALIEEIVAANPGMTGTTFDLDDPDAPRALQDFVRRELPDFNVLVNNAGVTGEEDLAGEWDTSTARRIVQTNIFGTLEVTAALLPLLKGRMPATIMTTTSGLAFLPRANYPTYCASKAFLHSWTQSLRTQLRPVGIEVLELIPPYVQTELAGAGQATDPAAMPLQDYIDAVMRSLEVPQPERGEVIEARAAWLRSAEREGRYDESYATLNGS
ncbi:SDR family oxidoreductase [Sphingomonas sp. BK580]|uniref:SDR family oxidoreductase n=1 Tax=Sphingomonas sp. BK580 TaxID=2586972 RepID=UPI00160E26DD|nr:SDR family NAD(P)-dependent oxidoreductase [Sphingomonas sp. BK580]MBB3695253.1 putative oxidoreductase [Sphingomonas sp. BK580]